MFRRRRDESDRRDVPPGPSVDPSTVPVRLRPSVDDAFASLERWRQLAARQAPGPLRDRLDEWTLRLDGAVAQIVDTATRVGQIELVLRDLDPDRVSDRFKAAKRAAAAGSPPPEFDALEARFASVQRMMNAVSDAEERLRVLDARLGAAVAQGAELVVMGDADGAARLDADIAGLVDELTLLRTSLGELS